MTTQSNVLFPASDAVSASCFSKYALTNFFYRCMYMPWLCRGTDNMIKLVLPSSAEASY